MEEPDGKKARAPTDLAALAREYLDLWEEKGAFHSPVPHPKPSEPDSAGS